MYLTAHHVKHRDIFTNKWSHGVNSFQYSHQEMADSNVHPVFVNVGDIAESNPGRLIKQHLELSPSGNVILSYLDLSAPDSIRIDQVQEALAIFTDKLQRGNFEFQSSEYKIGVRFWLADSVKDDLRREFDLLQKEMLHLFNLPELPKGNTPLVIMVEDNGEEFKYSIDPKGLKAIVSFQPDAKPARSCAIPHNVIDDFEKQYGDIHTQIIEGLTHLTLDQIIEIGGVVFKQASTNKTIKKWPSQL